MITQGYALQIKGKPSIIAGSWAPDIISILGNLERINEEYGWDDVDVVKVTTEVVELRGRKSA